MRFPFSLTRTMTSYLLKKKLAGEKKFPLVLMLEPLHACNLTCTGCGRIREYATTIKDKLIRRRMPGRGRRVRRTLREHLRRRADDLSGDRRTGGQDPRAEEAHLPVHQRHVHPQEAGRRSSPPDRFFWNVHLDGMEATHDMAVEREGVFAEAIEGIKAAKAAGFLVCTNTTIYKETDMHEIAVLLGYLTELGVDGFMMSPAYGYDAVQETNPLGAQQIFMTRDDIHEKFREAKKLLRRLPAEHFADLPGVPPRRARAAVRRLGQPDAQRRRLEGPLLPDHRRAPRDLSTNWSTRPTGTSSAAATIPAASTAWSTAASSRPPCWASTAAWATR